MNYLTINGVEYAFKFGVGFMKKVDRMFKVDVPEVPSIQKNIGLRVVISTVMDGDVESLETILMTANEGQNPRLTTDVLDAYIEDETTDIEHLFDEVLDFLRKANVTKALMKSLDELVEAQQ